MLSGIYPETASSTPGHSEETLTPEEANALYNLYMNETFSLESCSDTTEPTVPDQGISGTRSSTSHATEDDRGFQGALGFQTNCAAESGNPVSTNTTMGSQSAAVTEGKDETQLLQAGGFRERFNSKSF